MSIEDIEIDTRPSDVLLGFAIVALSAGLTGFALGCVFMWVIR